MKTSIRLLTAIAWLALAGLVAAQDSATEADAPEAQAFEETVAVVDSTSAEAVVDETVADETVVEDAGDMDSEAQAPAGNSAATEQPALAGPNGDQLSFTLQVHPIFTPDQADSVYRPLINYLNATTPHHFELQLARDFHRYWLEIRRGVTPDLVLEDAHLVALRIRRFDYTPLVKALDPATFSLLTSGMSINAGLTDFIGRPVSSMPAPSLGYLVLTSWYDNPMQQPIIQSNASSWLDAVEIVFSMEAEAAMVPHNLVERYVNMEIVRTSDEFPHATISASSNVPVHVQQDIIRALTALHEDPDYFSALHELDIEQFVPASTLEYEGLDRWLDQVFSFF